MCVCVCVCVSALTAELIEVWSQNSTEGLTLMTSRTSLMVKVIGQRSRLPGQKRWCSGVSHLGDHVKIPELCYGIMWRHDVTSVTSFDVKWRHRSKDRFGTREVQQHFSVFFSIIFSLKIYVNVLHSCMGFSPRGCLLAICGQSNLQPQAMFRSGSILVLCAWQIVLF